MRKFWIIEKGNVIYISVLKNEINDPREEKKEIAVAIIKALKEVKNE